MELSGVRSSWTYGQKFRFVLDVSASLGFLLERESAACFDLGILALDLGILLRLSFAWRRARRWSAEAHPGVLQLDLRPPFLLLESPSVRLVDLDWSWKTAQY